VCEKILFQSDSNQMQRGRAKWSVGRPTLCAITADFQSTHENVKLAIALYLTFQAIEQIALKLSDFSAAQASHVNVIALWPPFIEVLFALHVHQIKFIYQAIPLQQLQCSINRDPVDAGIDFAGMAKNL